MGQGVPDNAAGWTPQPQAGFQPPHSVGAHLHTESADVLSAIPSGTIWMWYGISTDVPIGWAICDGTNGTPNLKGRVPVGVDTAQAEFDVLGETGGAKTVTLSTADMPFHGHTQNSHNHGQDGHDHTDLGHTHFHAHDYTSNNREPPNHGHDIVLEATGNLTHHHAAGINRPAEAPSSGAPGFTYTTAGVNASLSHNHDGTTVTNAAVGVSDNQATTATNQGATATNQSTGGGGAHANLQPYLALHFIMKI